VCVCVCVCVCVFVGGGGLIISLLSVWPAEKENTFLKPGMF